MSVFFLTLFHFPQRFLFFNESIPKSSVTAFCNFHASQETLKKRVFILHTNCKAALSLNTSQQFLTFHTKFTNAYLFKNVFYPFPFFTQLVQEIPEEECNLVPQKSCSKVVKIVPSLVPKESCIDVPKEVCINARVNPRKIWKPVIKVWCGNTTEQVRSRAGNTGLGFDV